MRDKRLFHIWYPQCDFHRSGKSFPNVLIALGYLLYIIGVKMLAKVGEVIRDMEREGTHSYTWTAVETGMRCLSDRISSARTVYVHGIYEIHMKQIGSR